MLTFDLITKVVYKSNFVIHLVFIGKGYQHHGLDAFFFFLPIVT